MEELEKKAWKEALEYAFEQGDKNPWDKSQNYRDYAIEHAGKLYPNKIIYNYALDFLSTNYQTIYENENKNNPGVGKKMNTYLESKGANAITLNQAIDSNVNYWLYQPGENARLWNEFYEKSIIGLGWDDLGDLSLYQSKDDVVKELQAIYQTESSKKNDATANWDFFQNMQIGDIVLIKKGKRKLLGYGEILSDYIFDAEREEYTSIRKVKWIKKGEWDIDFDLVLKTLTIITDYNSDVLKGQKYYQYLLSIMNGNINRVNSKRINLIKYKKQIILQGPPGTGKTREAKLIAKEMLNLQDVKDLEGNDQFKLIQFHPSYTYEDFVRGIVSKPNEDGDGIIYEAENKLLADFAQKALDNYIESNKTNVVVHEDSSIFEAFIENIKDELAQNEHHKYDITEAVYLFSADETRFKYKGDNWVAHSKGLNMKFSELKKIIDSGATERQDIKKMTDVEELTRQHATYFIKIVEKYYTFKQTFKESIPLQHSTELKNYVLLIDEINRANLSSVLGELIYALEYRGEAVESMYAVDNDNKLVLPPNLYIIGTMNTADRSVGHIDYAIRRRFAFVDVLPQDLSNDENIIFDSQLFGQVALLFDSNLSPEFEKKDVQLGHSYFIDKTKEGGSMDIRLEYEIKPILFEYIKDGVLIGEDIEKLIEDLEQSI
ncbi:MULTISPECIES: McrB family protein [Myroides]|uniref:McrB family protein n=1 Tax=Myroides TaxID=76831 RepID=UPI0021034B38|nr:MULTISPECIES: AAA family ATPase [Myroides]MEC4077531.1 AAA family ATPase [Myroides odoratimimus]MEC4092470.1 AAA family ATPase [Myroides odoratimimus]